MTAEQPAIPSGNFFSDQAIETMHQQARQEGFDEGRAIGFEEGVNHGIACAKRALIQLEADGRNPVALTAADDISKLGLTTHTSSALINSHKIEKIGDLIKLTRTQVSQLNRIGIIALREIEVQLDANGFRLAD